MFWYLSAFMFMLLLFHSSFPFDFVSDAIEIFGKRLDFSTIFRPRFHFSPFLSLCVCLFLVFDGLFLFFCMLELASLGVLTCQHFGCLIILTAAMNFWSFLFLFSLRFRNNLAKTMENLISTDWPYIWNSTSWTAIISIYFGCLVFWPFDTNGHG